METPEDIINDYLDSMGLDEDEIESFYDTYPQGYTIQNHLEHEPTRILVYDIETTPLKNWTFRCGKQYVGYSSLDASRNSYDIICITYAYNDGSKPKAIHWGHGPEDSKEMTKEFDAIIREAQSSNTLIIGKNNKRFDDKHLNTHRWLNNQEPMPEWIKYTEDLETQLRRYFYLPSYSLDYASELRGLGGKMKMELKDWINIVEYKTVRQMIDKTHSQDVAELCPLLFNRNLTTIMKEGTEALNRMVEYGKKDVADTLALILDVSKYCEFKSHVKQYKGVLRCKDITCGSYDIRKNGTRVMNGTRYQSFYCNSHNGYAGRASMKHDGTFGKII